ncbi:hypothetical protein O181_003414 [Austropuccinia psidii MF-1]|uniref:ubiquitinyl hydrolase 1 n=1 Tax=Austropuccinia psidii MF-1 TaxID=1389203 RepID=A0A9Q3BEC0_9BASI|nr:hypothetical protein [Austropuccinia psidii MF-1]
MIEGNKDKNQLNDDSSKSSIIQNPKQIGNNDDHDHLNQSSSSSSSNSNSSSSSSSSILKSTPTDHQDYLHQMENINHSNSIDSKFTTIPSINKINNLDSTQISNSSNLISNPLSNQTNLIQSNNSSLKSSTISLNHSILSKFKSINSNNLNNHLSINSNIKKSNHKIRGLVGLTNLGNTCFMNSALQCLSNCPELKNYFLSRVYINELNRVNPLGMGGKLAETFGQLIEKIWSDEFGIEINSKSKNLISSSYLTSSSSSIAPREFKSIVGRFNSLFLGYGQQDSQELLTFLLDALHEDLNRVLNKPFDEIPDFDDNHSDDEYQKNVQLVKLSKTCWKLYQRRNDSVIVDLFQGQYKSTLVCPDCNKVAIKFDEIMYLTLQLPNNQKIKGSIYFIPLDPGRPRIKVVYELPKDSSIRQLKQHVASILNADPNKMAAIEDWSGRPWKIWQDTDSLEGVLEKDIINFFETPLPFAALKGGVYYSNQVENDQADLLIPLVSYRPFERANALHTNANSSRSAQLAFGVFFVVRVSKEDRMSYGGVYNAIVREYARYTTKAEDLFEEVDQDGDVEMKIVEGGKESRAVPNLFKIFVPKLPASTSFPISNSMNVPTIELEERIKQSASKTSDSFAIDSNGLTSIVKPAFEPDEPEDLYETKTLEKPMIVNDSNNLSSSNSPSAVVKEGDYFECEWTPSSMAYFFGLDKSLPHSKNWHNPPVIEDPELVATKAMMKDEIQVEKKSGTLTIEECFKDFSKPEKLGEDDKWYCPRCKTHVQAIKRMQIWKVPDILVVHFKRFSSARTSYGRSTKVDTFVDFPIEGLDLSQEVEGIKVMKELKKRQREQEQPQQAKSVNHPAKLGDEVAVKRQKEEEEEAEEEEEEESLVYDLFAVDNHFGGLGGGHYTAFAKNEEDGKWHNYDDSHVTEVTSPEKIKSSAAYLLFYRRRTKKNLGSKTHGIVSSALQSRDVSAAPSEGGGVSGGDGVEGESGQVKGRMEGEEVVGDDREIELMMNYLKGDGEAEGGDADGVSSSAVVLQDGSSDRCNSPTSDGGRCGSNRSSFGSEVSMEEGTDLIKGVGGGGRSTVRRIRLIDEDYDEMEQQIEAPPMTHQIPIDLTLHSSDSFASSPLSTSPKQPILLNRKKSPLSSSSSNQKKDLK